jgi:hypothetical protein
MIVANSPEVRADIDATPAHRRTATFVEMTQAMRQC